MLAEFNIYESAEGNIHLYFSDEVHIRFANLLEFKKFVGICALTVKQVEAATGHTVTRTKIPDCFKDALDDDM